ncbi:MAG TPA: PrsW family glutamic-type intramembrane protease [Gemmatimonadaceae bacterium]|jgi:RsiW-degrading membrane proteinase PrsW (M82 family)|nr:PrsW family glutamic-type intramembrane protease [Gemmatimonadaceae bacterium]
MLIPFAVSVLPVGLFLGALVLLDSYKLIPLRAILIAVAAGAAAGALSYTVNISLQPALGMDIKRYTILVAPVLEELLKAIYIVWLLRRNKVGFVVDAATYGFAVGTGFAFVENIFALNIHPNPTIWTWIVRGFGTALMHGGTSAIFAMISRTLNRGPVFRFALVLPGFVAAVVLHSLYNQFLVAPLLATALIVLVFPYIVMFLFKKSERETSTWLGTGFDTDQELLRVMRAGEVSDTPVGQYLKGLRTTFPPEVIVDMMCLLQLRAELGIKAKGMLLMREAGFEAEPDPSLRPKLEEVHYLEKNIGRTGMRALKPFVHTSTQDLWQMNLLDGTK